MLTARQLLVFKCIVEEFIETAEPVGSKTLMTKYQLPFSSATIRNEMSYLEKYGYLEKTHTSSGRVPSVEGYRFYVENLENHDVEENVKNQIAVLFSDHHKALTETIRQSCEMLSELTHLTSVYLGSDANVDTLQRISVVPLGDNMVTAIIITKQGHVQNKVFVMQDDQSMENLLSCVDVMNDLLIGTPINSIAMRLERDVKPILSVKIKEHEQLFNAFLEAFVKFAQDNVYFSGKENIMYQPEFNDVNKIRRLVSAFENTSMMQQLLPDRDSQGVTVKIGEAPYQELGNVSVVSASFKTSSTRNGTISVIGPTRMPYEKVVSLVEYVAEQIEKSYYGDGDKKE